MKGLYALQEQIDRITAPMLEIEELVAPMRKIEEKLLGPERRMREAMGLPSKSSQHTSYRSSHQGTVKAVGISEEQAVVNQRQAAVNEKAAIERERMRLDINRILEKDQQGMYVMKLPNGLYLNVGWGSDLDERIKTHESKAGGEWILMAKTYGVSKTEEGRVHANLKAAGHKRYGNKKEEYENTPELVADLRKARLIPDDVSDTDFFQGTLAL
ncbi:hypothetical protein SynBIOSE41_00854 [Synechococcus sp. BIOS-E4-1]|uniref:hypothetical protein n=1 Tax=Synechococcus sp. BIOS-E4-1 TaxID=1400864 RepID=UPI0016444C59|nr:hypothetical protein [Synechococcus sp. BIOS-E4-1]QNI53386.1 hypothetical protein SynBIOSE41_00854 [Synechococcus sp. BIOS-E4-1]